MAAGRRRTLAQELKGEVEFVRRAYLLLAGEGQRPAYDEYVVSHRVRAAQMNPELGFAIPKVGQKYPRSSVPAQVVAAAVEDEHPERLEAIEDQLFGAMFRELRDVSDPTELGKCAQAAGVPEALVDRALADRALRDRVFAQHQEALDEGVQGVPALLVPGYAPVTGAVPLDALRRAFAGVLASRAQHP
ncbi:MAG TPA: DsbA family protein [Myxococcales bacterium]|nr:DsbA family protein [Myxococcales bacterium]